MRWRTVHLVAIAVIAAALGLAACGDDDDEGSNAAGGSDDSGGAQSGGYGGGGGGDEETGGGGGGTTLRLSADPGGALKFDKSSLTTKAGKVTIVMKNPSSATAPHAVEIEGKGVEEESDVVDPGGTAKVTATLEPGTYEFYCPVGDHADAGMEGELTVK
jgi:plastocyanin